MSIYSIEILACEFSLYISVGTSKAGINVLMRCYCQCAMIHISETWSLSFYEGLCYILCNPFGTQSLGTVIERNA